MKSLDYFSTHRVTTDILDKYSHDRGGAFYNDIKKAKTINIVSPFYDVEYFKKLRETNKRCTINVTVQAEKGWMKAKRQQSLLGGLMDIDRKIQFNIVGEWFLLHTKFYHIETSECNIYWIGSSNSTMNSVENCEELMARKVYKAKNKKLHEYLNAICGKSRAITKCLSDVKVNSVRDFFSQGFLCNKLTENFLPYIEFYYGDRSEDVKERLNKLSLGDDYLSSLFKTKNKISLFDLVKLHAKVNGLDSDLLTGEYSNDATGDNNQLKRFGLYTNLGLWIPDGYSSVVSDTINSSAAVTKRKNYFDEMLKFLSNKNNVTGLETTLRKLLSKIADAVDMPNDAFHSDVNFEKLRRQAEFAKARLSQKDSTYYRRLVFKYITSPMPAIWDDQYAADDFMESFYSSLELESSRGKTSNLLYNSLMLFYGLFRGGKDEDYFEQSCSLAKYSDKIKLLVCDNKTRFRYFEQSDLLNLLKYNAESDRYTFTPLSQVKASVDEDVYFKDWLNKKTFFVKGKSLNGSLCRFEDGDVLSTKENEDDIYTIKVGI